MKRNLRPKRLAATLIFLAVLLCAVGVALASDEDTNYFVSGDAVYYVDDWTDEDGNVTPAYEAFSEEDGYSGYWTILSEDTWMYTFYVYDDSILYYVWEDEVEGYTGDYTIYNPYYMSTAGEVAIITNTSEDNPEYGSVAITKVVVDSDGNETEDISTFSITVTITDADGNALSGSKIYGDTAFSNGVANISLTNGSTVTLTDIPEGYIVSIEETNYGSYSVSYSSQSVTVVADETQTMTVTNSKEGGDEDEEESVYMDITLVKEVSGYYETTDDVYTFWVSFEGLELGTSYDIEYSGDAIDGTAESVVSDNTGAAVVKIFLKAGQSAVIKDIPEGATYAVMEEGGEYIASYEIEDAQGLGLITQDSGYNTAQDKSLSTQEESADADATGQAEEITITFTNELERTQDVSVAKISLDAYGEEDEEDDTQYEVTAVFSNLPSNFKIYSDVGAVKADDEGYAEVTFYISAGETVTFSDLPVGTTYTFTEAANEKTASFVITDSNETSQIVSASGENESSQTDLSTSEETVNEGEDVTVTFTNSLTDASAQAVKYNSDESEALAGAVFSLYKVTDDGDELIAEGLETGEDGYTEVTDGLTVGTYYFIETSAPDGYFLNSAKSQFEVTEDDLGTTITVNIKDSILTMLASSGGIGIWLLVLASLIAAALAAAAVIIKNKRKAGR